MGPDDKYKSKNVYSRTVMVKVWSYRDLCFSPLKGDLTTWQNCMEFLSGRQVSPLVGISLWPFSSPSMELLGKFQFSRDNCFNSLMSHRDGHKHLTRISSFLSEQLHLSFIPPRPGWSTQPMASWLWLKYRVHSCYSSEEVCHWKFPTCYSFCPYHPLVFKIVTLPSQSLTPQSPIPP